jgi:hypothetical protein
MWFGLRYLPGMGLAEPERWEVIAWGVAECAIVALLLVNIVVQRSKAVKVFDIRTSADKTIVRWMSVWFVLCICSALLGVAHGNQWDYLLGDLYRFGLLPVICALIYCSVKDAGDVCRTMRGFVAVYGIIVALDLIRFNSFIRDEQERLTTEAAHQAGMIAVAVIYLMLFDEKRWVRRASVGVLLLMTILLLRAQMLTPLITSLMAMALYFCLSRKRAVFVGCAIALGILVAASFYSVSVTPAVPAYIADKLAIAQESAGPAESLQALSGSRIGEIISIEEEFAAHPSNLLLGTGEGSVLSPDPLLDSLIPTDKYVLEKHYVHAGLFDALYHNGLAAVGVFLAILAQLFRRGRRMYNNGNPFGLFVMINLIVTTTLLCFDLPFESALPLLALCFAGVGVMENQAKQSALSLHKSIAQSELGTTREANRELGAAY